ncbi:MAG: HD domain-containing protein [Bacilli bacterium]|nr:HD domain-containing protein [Bacilli bacterium]
MIEKEIEEFTKYYNTFDTNVEAIKMKYNHTLRVIGYAKKIIENEQIDDDVKRLSLLGALLHDIARFKQWTDYGTYSNQDSFDHGDMGYEILKKDDYINNYVQDEKEKNIILNAVKQHNKKYLELSNDVKKDCVAKVARDADKIDILVHQYNLDDTNLYLYKNYLNEFGKISEKQFIISDILVEDLLNHRLCSNENVKYYFDAVLREMAFVFDLNFKASFKIVKDLKIVDKKIKLLNEYNKKDTEKINLIAKTINDFIDEKLEEI